MSRPNLRLLQIEPQAWS